MGEELIDPDTARRWIEARRAAVRERLDRVEGRLTAVRGARGDWVDEEHDPEGFSLTVEWSQAQGTREEHLAELRALDAAEARLAAGDYGRCERCGQPIPAAQLELRPARTVCVACADRRR
jgi:RNA polymerase-binding transcription factor DksA